MPGPFRRTCLWEGSAQSRPTHAAAPVRTARTLRSRPCTDRDEATSSETGTRLLDTLSYFLDTLVCFLKTLVRKCGARPTRSYMAHVRQSGSDYRMPRTPRPRPCPFCHTFRVSLSDLPHAFASANESSPFDHTLLVSRTTHPCPCPVRTGAVSAACHLLGGADLLEMSTTTRG